MIEVQVVPLIAVKDVFLFPTRTTAADVPGFGNQARPTHRRSVGPPCDQRRCSQPTKQRATRTPFTRHPHRNSLLGRPASQLLGPQLVLVPFRIVSFGVRSTRVGIVVPRATSSRLGDTVRLANKRMNLTVASVTPLALVPSAIISSHGDQQAARRTAACAADASAGYAQRYAH